MRRKYKIEIVVNDILVQSVIIDSHYEKKHSKDINDEIILDLVRMLDGKTFEPDDVKPPYKYFVADKIFYKKKYYKLIRLLEENQIYIGIVNVYRRR